MLLGHELKYVIAQCNGVEGGIWSLLKCSRTGQEVIKVSSCMGYIQAMNEEAAEDGGGCGGLHCQD